MSKKDKAENPVPETEETKAPETEPENTAEQTEPEAADKAPEDPPKEDPVKALEAKLAELNDRYLRTLAEYENFRRRTQKEKEALFGDGKAEDIGKILPALDNFERAAAADGDFETYKKGVEMTVTGLMDILKAMGLEAFGEKGEPFDPNVHNGVMHEDNNELEENVISDVFLKGYKLGDRVIRHATVKVAN